MKEDRIYEIIGKQLSGQSSQGETEELQEWLSKDEHNPIIFEALQEHWHSGNQHSPDKEKVLRHLYQRINESSRQIIWKSNKPASQRRLIPQYLYPVAAAVGFFVIFLSWFVYNNQVNRDLQTEVVETVEKIVPPGQKSTIRLNDGSVVKLNAGSKLRYPRQFNEFSREVYLEGEAFFEVRKEVSRPFVVTSGDIVTSVLGTSFNVKAYSEENLIKVALVTGKVKVRHISPVKNQFDYTLTPNEMFTYDKERHSPVKGPFIIEEVLAWKNQTLFFENAGLNEMTMVLQRWYGKKFVINNGNIITRKFSGKFENNRSLEYVLNVLSLNSNFTYQIIDDTVIIDGKP